LSSQVAWSAVHAKLHALKGRLHGYTRREISGFNTGMDETGVPSFSSKFVVLSSE
jgi:hypothetical protein